MASPNRVTLAVLATLVATGALVGCDGGDPAPAPSPTTASTTATPDAVYTVPTGFGPEECPFVDPATLTAADPTGTFADPTVKYLSGAANCSFVFDVSSQPTRAGVVTVRLTDGVPADVATQQSEVYSAAAAPDLGADTFRLTGLPEDAAGQIKLGVLEPVDPTQSLLITLLLDPVGSDYTAENVRAFADAVATAVTLT